jgi:hypothetical protein
MIGLPFPLRTFAACRAVRLAEEGYSGSVLSLRLFVRFSCLYRERGDHRIGYRLWAIGF